MKTQTPEQDLSYFSAAVIMEGINAQGPPGDRFGSRIVSALRNRVRKNTLFPYDPLYGLPNVPEASLGLVCRDETGQDHFHAGYLLFALDANPPIDGMGGNHTKTKKLFTAWAATVILTDTLVTPDQA